MYVFIDIQKARSNASLFLFSHSDYYISFNECIRILNEESMNRDSFLINVHESKNISKKRGELKN